MINWAGFIPTALLVSLIPGANQLLGLSNAVRHGAAYALAGIGGRLVAFVILIGLVVAGLGAALAASATALTVIKWVGVVYLAWVGFSSLRRAWRAPPAAAASAPTAGRGLRPLVVNEFAVAISNPKALLLFAALLPQFTRGPEGGTDTQTGPARGGLPRHRTPRRPHLRRTRQPHRSHRHSRLGPSAGSMPAAACASSASPRSSPRDNIV